MDPADSRRITRVPRYSGYRAAPSAFAYRIVTFYDGTFQTLPLRPGVPPSRSYYPAAASPRRRFGLLPVRSPLLGESLLFSLPGGTKMFQFPPFASPQQNAGIAGLQPAGLSHSETGGSTATCASPPLIAACHVLRRLCEPRHPPSALSCFLSPDPTISRGTRQGSCHTFGCMNILVSILLSTVLPVSTCQRTISRQPPANGGKGRVENNGFEPLTPCLQSRCSSQLS